MKSDQQESVYKLAAYTATRILDDVLKGKSVIDYKEVLTGNDIYSNLKNGVTRDIVFNNIDMFDTCLNNLIYNRMDYLCAEGLLTFDNNQCYRVRTEAEMEEFLNID